MQDIPHSEPFRRYPSALWERLGRARSPPHTPGETGDTRAGRPALRPQRKSLGAVTPWAPPCREAVRALLIDGDPAHAADLACIAARSKQLNFDLSVRATLPQDASALSIAAYDVVFLEYWHGTETCIPFLHAMTALQGPPCVVLTDLNEPDIRRIVFRAGAEAFLGKDALSAQALESVTLTVLRARRPDTLAAE